MECTAACFFCTRTFINCNSFPFNVGLFILSQLVCVSLSVFLIQSYSLNGSLHVFSSLALCFYVSPSLPLFFSISLGRPSPILYLLVLFLSASLFIIFFLPPLSFCSFFLIVSFCKLYQQFSETI